ncbi:MAG: 50S ribosomal protein L20 [Candidatus Eiseniibacteriota bacterium]|nr:MAG: 50S ribosomal protein L20 [Candidatus Eisenbacteria bacterium]
MPRARTVPTGRRRRKKTLKAAKGFRGGRHRLYRTARETLMRSLQYAYRDRRTKKRDFRELWIARINAAARVNGISYSRFISGLRKADVEINRKALAHIALHDRAGFAKLAELAKSASQSDAAAG